MRAFAENPRKTMDFVKSGDVVGLAGVVSLEAGTVGMASGGVWIEAVVVRLAA